MDRHHSSGTTRARCCLEALLGQCTSLDVQYSPGEPERGGSAVLGAEGVGGPDPCRPVGPGERVAGWPLYVRSGLDYRDD